LCLLWILLSVPVVLLVNGFSASASEIFSANLKYYRKAILIGTRTYGKGTVQEIEPLGDAGAVKLTIAEYITAGGYHVEGKGVEPDIKVDLSKSTGEKEDLVLKRAEKYLEEHLGK
jgi:carboxyl-terminal processing protease